MNMNEVALDQQTVCVSVCEHICVCVNASVCVCVCVCVFFTTPLQMDHLLINRITK